MCQSNFFRCIVIFCLTPLFVSCSSIDVEDYAGTSPNLDVFEFFSGDLIASGVVKNRSGKVIRHFNADIKTSYDGKVLILDETFLFSDGEKDYRKWEITRSEPGRYKGTANDIIGSAEGEAAGNALRWKYDLVLEVNDRSIEVEFDDWMFQTSDNILINISDIKKWGFKVGEVVLVIVRNN